MKIGIDTFGCGHGKSGISSYLQSLLHAVTLLGTTDEVELFGFEEDRFSWISGGSSMQYQSVSVGKSDAAVQRWHTFFLPAFVKLRGYDVVLYPAATRFCPAICPVPAVPLVLDVLTSLFEKKHPLMYKKKLLRFLNKAPLVIAASQFIKKNLVAHGIDAEKIEVVHPGIDHSMFYPHTEFDSDLVVIKPFAIKRPYILYASRIDGRNKMHSELIKAFSLFKKKTGFPHRLVLAGDDGYGTDSVLKTARESEYASDIFITGYFPHKNMPELYSCADLFMFPPVQEGIGIPVLEAMATGIPVAVAKSGALFEIAGDNAIYFEGGNIEDMARAMESGVTDTKLRASLVDSALWWVKRFTWERSLDMIREIVERAALMGNE